MSVFRWLGIRSRGKKRHAGTRPRCALWLEMLEDRAVPASVQPISVVDPGTTSSGDSILGKFALSRDGRYVAFESGATNLVAGDTNGANDVFVRDMLLGTLTRVNTNSAGNQANGTATAPALIVDSSGNVIVAFQSDATNLIAADNNNSVDIFVKNLTTGVITLASTDSSGNASEGFSAEPALFLTGSGAMLVAFQSTATNLVTGDTNDFTDVFLKNLSTGQTTLISTDSIGSSANNASANAALAVDGSGAVFVAFESDADNLTVNDLNSKRDVFVKNVTSGVTSIASTDSTGTQGNGASAEPALAIDASNNVFVAFQSDADNLIVEDFNGALDVFVKNLTSGATIVVSTDSNGAQGNDASSNTALIIDGSIVHVAYSSLASNLVADDTNAASDVFVKNVSTLVTSRVSTSSASVQGDSTSSNPALAVSAAGAIVTAFQSLADNLVSGDDNGVVDIFLKNVTTNATTAASRISMSLPLLAGNSSATKFALSKNGRYVAFESSVSNIVSDDTNNVADIFVRDTVLGTITRVSTSSNGNQANGPSFAPAIAVDNAGVVYVAFHSAANNLVSGDNNGLNDIFVKNLTTGVTVRASTDSSAAQGNGNSDSAALAIDGSGTVYVTFTSAANNLVASDSNTATDVFIKNLTTGITTRVSTDGTGAQSNGPSSQAAVAFDGIGGILYVAFSSTASSLVASDTNSSADVFVKNLTTGATTRVSTATAGTQANNGSFDPALAVDGSGNVFVTFWSNAGNLVSGDTNAASDVFVKNLINNVTTRVSTDSAGIQGNNSSSMASLAFDSGGNVLVAFESLANNLVGGDSNNAKDVFIKNLTTAVIVRISTDASGNQGNSDSSIPALTINGNTTFVAFSSLAGNLVVGDDNASQDVFLWQQTVVSAATQFTISAPANTTSGNVISVTVTARDAGNNIATGYNGTIHFTSTDSQAILPANSTLANGIGTFSVTLKSVGNKTVTATDTITSSVTGTSAAIAVAGPIHLGVVASSSVTAGDVLLFTVTALDDFNGTVNNYTGIVHLTSSDGQASLTANATLNSGVGFFAAALKTAGAQTISATDTVSSAINGTSGSISVQAGAAASFYVDLPSGSFLAGNGFAFTVAARDLYHNTATAYSGTVHFTSSDPQAVLPPDSTLTNGTGVFSTVLKSAGTFTVYATDTSVISLSAGGTITVDARPVTHFSVSAPGGSIAPGSAVAFTVTARDPFENTVSGYSGTVHFSSSDGLAALPPDATLSGGTGAFAAILKSSGNQTISATDTASSGLTGSAMLSVLATGGPATHFVVSAQSTTTAGNALVFSVTALDEFNTTATGYNGTVHFSSSDNQAFLPFDTSLTSGVGYFAAILRTAGNQTITVAGSSGAGSISGTSNSVAVAVSSLHHFGVSAPSTAITGNAFNFTVAAQDQFNNTIPTYNGTVHFTSSDVSAVLPANATLTSGSRIFSATLKTSGNQSITATDTSTAVSITGSSANIATRGLVVTGTTATTNGFTATFNKPFDPGTTASPVINLYDSNSALGVTDVTLARNAIQTITFGTAGGFTNGSTFTLAFNGSTTGAITYSTSTATLQSNIQNALNALTTIGAGNTAVNSVSATSVIVTFQNAKGFQAVSSLTSPSPGGSPNPVQIATTVSGSANMRGSLLINPGNQGMTFLLSSTGAAGMLAADTYQITIRSAATGFKDLLGGLLDGNNDGVTGDNFVTTFTVATTPTVILNIPDFARGPDSSYNVRIPNGSAGEEVQTITFTGTANGSTFNLGFNGVTASGITYSTTAATLQSNIQTALDGLSTINNTRRAGTAVVSTNATSATVRFQNVMGGFDQPLLTTSTGTLGITQTAAGVNTGIPVTLNGATGVTALTFDLLYNPALLTITGAYNVAGGSTLTLVGTPSGGVAHFSFAIGTAPALGASATLGHIVGFVPSSAQSSFKAKQILQLSSIVATGAAATPVGNNAVHIVAFFGDANGDGTITGGDAALVSRVNSNVDAIGTAQVAGLAAYRNLDPLIMVAFIANGNGNISASDVTLINSYLVRSQTQIPTPPPSSDLALVASGADPTLSLPSDLRAAAGETVVVPVNIDITRPGDSPGMMEAILALRYDTSVFTVSASDIQLGSVPSAGHGWQLRTAVNSVTGEIGINIFSVNPILTRGGGSLVTVSLHVREGAVAGASAINLVTTVNPTGQSEYGTSVSDSMSQYILYPVITDGLDAGVDGRVTVPAPMMSTSMTSASQFVFTPGAATAEAAGFEPFEPVQLSAVLTSELPEVVLEEVFGDFEAAAMYLAASGLGKSATTETDMDRVGSSSDELALWWHAEGAASQDWMSDESLSSLSKTMRRNRRLLTSHAEEASEEVAGVEVWPPMAETGNSQFPH